MTTLISAIAEKLLNKRAVPKSIDFLIMFEDDLVYDPYPLKKLERKSF